MAQQLRIYTILAEDLNLAPSAFIGQLTTTCNSSSRNLIPSSCLCSCTFTPNHTHKHTIKNKTFNKLTNYEVNVVAHTLVIPALVMPIQENHPEFDASLGYIVRSCLKNKTTPHPQNQNLKTNPLNNLPSSTFMARPNNISFKQA